MTDITSGIRLESTLTCPACGFRKLETMPTDACQYFYECASCHALLRPKPGDCCVFCSYGDVPCPPIQQSKQGGSCCAGGAGGEVESAAEAGKLGPDR